jgi:glycosyltransferase involved in cell wall biosynthesis
MRVLLLSGYDAESHRYWRERLQGGITDWQWQVLALSPRFFSWRIRGNPLYWAVQERAVLEQDVDLVLATSMVDLATLRGLVPGLAQLPAALYFHENQFAYPQGRGAHGALEARMVSLYSAMAAHCLLFNSNYNLETFMSGCETMLNAFPDAVPCGVVSDLRNKARVLPVPMEFPSGSAPRPESSVLQLLWNHRWEYDKGPERLLAIVQGLLAQELDFCLNVVGQQFRQRPEAFDEIRALLTAAGRLGNWGYIEEVADYQSLLASCDVVLSTALHDFQGLSMVQACAAGCSPLAPARLVYPEWLDQQFLYAASDSEPQTEAEAAVEKIVRLAAMKVAGEALPLADVSAFSADVLLPQYRSVLQALA